MEKTLPKNPSLKLNLNESISNSSSSKEIKKDSKNKKMVFSKSTPQLTKKISSKFIYKKTKSEFFNYNDKIEKKMYLENISLKTKRNSELLSKLSSTFRSYSINTSNDPLIESNLFKIGAKRSFLLTKGVNKVRKMIQNFDEEFMVDLNANKNDKRVSKVKTIKDNKNSLSKIEEESFDFDLNHINTKNESKSVSQSNNNPIIKSKKSSKKRPLLLTNHFFDKKDVLKSTQGKKFLQNNEKIEKRIQNSEKFSQLTDAFKFYELLYKYKYFLTKKDNEFLSFSRRRKMERAFSAYNQIPKSKLYNYEESCEKCKNDKRIDYLLYKNSLNYALKNDLSNSRNSEDEKINIISQRESTKIKNKELELSLQNSEKNKKQLKRSLSGFMTKYKNNKNIININSKLNNNTRPTTASISQTHQSSQYSNSNTLRFKSKLKNELDLESAISNTSSYKTNLAHNKRNRTINPKKTVLLLKKKIKNLSKEILDNGDKLKIGLKSKYKSTMKIIEEEKKPVTKVKKDRNINIKKIRKDLNLKRRGNGIDEKKLIMENVDKLYKTLPKGHVKLMRGIAKIVINEDRMRLRPLFYNDTYDNKLFKMKLKKEMFDAQCEMRKIRKTLSKNKKEKDFKQQVKKLMKNEMFLFFNLNSLKQMVDKYKVLRGECLSNNQ